MSSKAKIAILSALTGVVGVGLVTGTISWFKDVVEISFGQHVGSGQGAYFAGGDGLTKETAFIIKNKNHVYNLAWLQYLNYFSDDDGNPVQRYFRVDNDVNMEGLVIPPIGTAEHPFIGFFDGGSHVIHNFSVSNTIGNGNITRRPSTLINIGDGTHLLESGEDPNPSPINIVGFFGVVGEFEGDSYSYGSSTPEIKNLGLGDFRVQTSSSTSLMGLAAGYVNGDLSGVAVGESEFDIPSETAPTTYTSNLSDYALVGYATDSCIGNLDVVDVEARRPSIDDGANEDGGDEYGASIPMKKIYDRLVAVKNADHSVSPYSSSSAMQYLSEGEFAYESSEPTNPTYTNYPTQTTDGGTNWTFVNAEEKDGPSNDSDVISQFSFSNRSGTDQYMYLQGAKEYTISDGLTKHSWGYQTATAFYISKVSGGTTHYLTADGTTGIKDSTTQDSATKWFIEDGAIFFSHSEQQYYLSFNGTSLSLTTSTSSQTQWTRNGAKESYSNIYGNNVYALTYNNGWNAVRDNEAATKYLLKSYNTSSYLRANGTSSFSVASEENASLWSLNNNQYTTVLNGNTYYLCTKSNSSYDPGLRLYTENTYALTQSGSGPYYLRGGSYYSRWSGTYYYYYLYLNNGSWSTVADTGNNNAYRIDRVSVRVSDSAVYSLTRTQTTAQKYGLYDSITDSKVSTNPTYFPLQYRADNTVKNTNTGYIISGTNYDHSGSFAGDIRVSYYPYVSQASSGGYRTYYRYNLGMSLSSSGTATSFNDSSFWVLTKTAATGGAFRRISDAHNKGANNAYSSLPAAMTVDDLGLTKYNDARQDFGTALSNGGSSIYGLHFMNAAISPENKISVPKVTINNTLYQNHKAYEITPVLNNGERQYTDDGDLIIQFQSDEEATDMGGDYEFPEDCIDFNLKDNGAINFFAGSYFPGNTTFFSLHRIFRDNQTGNKNAITSIKKISKIYKNLKYDPTIDEHSANYEKDQYILEYATTPTTYSDPDSSKRGDSPIFDMSWITTNAGISSYSVSTSDNKNSYGACFYFEIPVIPGEYALGSDSSGDGAYLMYLDIGSAENNANKIILSEQIKFDTDIFVYPMGIDFAVFVIDEERDSDDFAVYEGGEVAAVIVPISVRGEIAFELDNNILSCGPPAGKTMTGNLTTARFIGDGITVNGNAGTITANRDSWESVTITRTTTFRYNVINNQVSEVYEEIIETTNASGTTRSGSDNYDDPKTYVLTSSEFDTTWLIPYASQIVPTDPYVTFEYYAKSTNDIDVSYSYSFYRPNAQSSGTYTYEFTISCSEDIQIHLGDILSGYLMKINGNSVSSDEDVDISAS